MNTKFEVLQDKANEVTSLQTVVQSCFNVDLLAQTLQLPKAIDEIWFCLGIAPMTTKKLNHEAIVLFGFENCKEGDPWPIKDEKECALTIAKKLITARKYLPLSNNVFLKENIFHVMQHPYTKHSLLITALNIISRTIKQYEIKNIKKFALSSYIPSSYLVTSRVDSNLFKLLYLKQQNEELENCVVPILATNYILLSEDLKYVMKTLLFSKSQSCSNIVELNQKSHPQYV